MDPETVKTINGIHQDKNYREFLSWITDGGLRYAFAKYNNLPNKETLYRSTVPTEKVKDVIVVGAGMAGLTAAYELAQVGHKVTILEATDRVGGRVCTHRFDDGMHCEAGAMRIPQQHFLVAHYIDLFGLRTETFRNTNPNTFLHMHGQKIRNSDWQIKNREYCDKLWPGWDANLPEGHNVNGIVDLYKRTFESVMTEMSPESSEHEWQSWVRKWNNWTMDKFLRSDCYQEEQHEEKLRPWPEAAIKAYMESTYNPIFNGEMSGFLRKIVERSLDNPMYGLIEGMDTLPKAFLSKNEKSWNKDVELQNNVIYDAIVQKIELIRNFEGNNRIQVIFRNRITDETSMHEADAAILTIPFPILKQLDLPLPEAKKRALEDIRLYDSTKILLQCRSRFWEKDLCEGGFSTTTLPIGQLHYCTSERLRTSGSQRGILMVFAWGNDARALGDKEENVAIEEAVGQISQIHPEIKTEFECGKVYAWHKQPFCQCVASSLGHVGYVDRLETLNTPAEGLPLYLAGEGLSWSKGWVQGAIFSGLFQAYCLQSNIEDGSVVRPVSMLR